MINLNQNVVVTPSDHDDDVGLLGGESAGAPDIGAVAHRQEEHDPLQLHISAARARILIKLVQHHSEDGDHHGAGGGVTDEHGEQGGDHHEGRQQTPPPRAGQHEHLERQSLVETNIL